MLKVFIFRAPDALQLQNVMLAPVTQQTYQGGDLKPGHSGIQTVHFQRLSLEP